ncbi:hypothetical protein D3C87_1997280 [compost metagenome]
MQLLFLLLVCHDFQALAGCCRPNAEVIPEIPGEDLSAVGIVSSILDTVAVAFENAGAFTGFDQPFPDCEIVGC